MTTENLNDIVRNNIIKIMKIKDLQPKDIQKISKFKIGTFYTYLGGSRNISLKVLNNFSKLLNVSPKLLIDKNLIVKKNIEVIIKENNNYEI